MAHGRVRQRTILADEADKLLGQSLLSTGLVQLGYVESVQVYVINFHLSYQLM